MVEERSWRWGEMFVARRSIKDLFDAHIQGDRLRSNRDGLDR